MDDSSLKRIGVAGCVIGVLVGFVVLAYAADWEWTGLPSSVRPVTAPLQTFEPEKTLWDWLQLLIIPAVLGAGTVWFNMQQTAAANSRAEEARREDNLQVFIDQMSALMLDKGLVPSKDGADVRAVARARTLTALRNLDAHRKVVLLRFLYDSRLLDVGQAKVDLRGANFDDIRLDGTGLPAVDLRGAKLRHASMRGADLRNADLRGADMRGSFLNNADIRSAKLGESTASLEADSRSPRPSRTIGQDNTQDWFPPADLSGADLTDALLDGTDMRHVRLDGATITEAQLESGIVQ